MSCLVPAFLPGEKCTVCDIRRGRARALNGKEVTVIYHEIEKNKNGVEKLYYTCHPPQNLSAKDFVYFSEGSRMKFPNEKLKAKGFRVLRNRIVRYN